MPRIAATLGVFALVVCALALNMAQFPIECGAVTRPKAADESEQSAPPAKIARMPAVAPPAEIARMPAVAPPAEIARMPAVALQSPESGPTAGDTDSTEPHEPVQQAADEEGDAQATDEPGAETAEHQDRVLSSSAPDETEAHGCDATGCSLDGMLGMDAEAGQDEPSVGEEAWSSSADIYNPLEPQAGAGTAAFGEAPPEFPGLGAATEAEPGPPYAAAGPPADTEDRNLVPVDPTAATEAAGEAMPNGVVRLPPVDEAWPSVSADTPSPDPWHPSADD